jgi:outer membrane beta-barrel protein
MPRSTFLSSPSIALGRWTALAMTVLLLGTLPTEASAASPGTEAVERYKNPSTERSAVENRFFLKQNRFEISPIAGYVPNNPFARRYMVGGIFGYHFNETFSAQADIMYSPDFGESDLKGLTFVLLDRAFQSNSDDNVNFQQPLDKAGLTASFGVGWSPLYGKINLVGETVLNFDFYMFAGAGIISKLNYNAKYDEAAADGNNALLQPDVDEPNEVKVAPWIGVGQNYFVNRLMAVKLDLRAGFYVDGKPQYDPEVRVTEQRLYNNVIASAGLAFFFPNMKDRLYNF